MPPPGPLRWSLVPSQPRQLSRAAHSIRHHQARIGCGTVRRRPACPGQPGRPAPVPSGVLTGRAGEFRDSGQQVDTGRPGVPAPKAPDPSPAGSAAGPGQPEVRQRRPVPTARLAPRRFVGYPSTTGVACACQLTCLIHLPKLERSRGFRLRCVRQGAGLRQQRVALAPPHPASLEPEHSARPRDGRQDAPPAERVHLLHQGRQGHALTRVFCPRQARYLVTSPGQRRGFLPCPAPAVPLAGQLGTTVPGCCGQDQAAPPPLRRPALATAGRRPPPAAASRGRPGRSRHQAGTRPR
jgi:hypothetical protein